MNQKEGLLLLGVIITLFCVPAAVTAAGSGSYDPYITVTLESPKEYLNLKIEMIDALDPLDVGTTSVTLKSSETRDLKAIEGPLLGDITRKFDPASGTYHGVDVTVHYPEKTVDGRTLPCEYQVYTKRTIPSFTVKVPGRCGNVLLIKCPENLPEGANFTELFRAASKEGYLFKSDAVIYLNQTGITVFGSITSDVNNLTYTLLHNEVDLTCFNTDASLAQSMMNAKPYTRPAAGEYLIAAVEYDPDTDTMHVLAAMPVLILDGNPAVTWTGDNPYYQDQNKDATVSFTGADKIAYALVKKDTRYGLDMEVDTIELAKQPIPVSATDLVSILKTIAGRASPITYNLTVDGVPTRVSGGSGFVIAEGYGCSGYANASSVTIPAATLQGLNEGTYSLYALGMNGQKVVAVDQKEVVIKAKPSGGGGGGGGSSYTSYTETGTLKVGNTGTVLRSIKVKAEDGIGSLFVPIGTTALDADGKPLSEVSITAIGRADLPDVPYGAAYTFAGYAYETSPDGATFEPEITLSLEFPDADWNALDPDNNNFIVKWYNEETYQWEDVPTTVFQSTKSVDAKITHFSTFALFSEPVTTPIDTSPTTPTTPSTPPADEAPPTEGLSMTMIIVILIIIIIVIAAGYYFLVRK